jgi:hypothetical protein
MILTNAGCTPAITSLQKSWPVQYNNNWRGHAFYIYALVERGWILTKSNDTLRGIIKLLPQAPSLYSYVQILPEGENCQEDIIKVEAKNIQYVVVDHASFYDSAYTYFVNINDKYFWRLLAKKDGILILDEADWSATNHSTLTPEYYTHYGHKMFLFRNERRIRISHVFQAMSHRNDVRPLLLKFINKRYSKSFRKRDFKKVSDMFDYILNEENKLIKINSDGYHSNKSKIDSL